MVEVVPDDLVAEGQCQEVDEEVVWALRFSCCQWRAELLHLKTYLQMEVAVGWYLVAAGQAAAHDRQACSEAFSKETDSPLYCQNCVARAAAKLCGRCHPLRTNCLSRRSHDRMFHIVFLKLGLYDKVRHSIADHCIAN